MNANETDLLLLAAQSYDSPDLLELSRLNIFNIYLNYYGKQKAFAYLQRLYELNMSGVNLKLSIKILAYLFGLTWFLTSPIYRFIAQTSLDSSRWINLHLFYQPAE